MTRAEEAYRLILDLYRDLVKSSGNEKGGPASEPFFISFDPDGDAEAFARRLIDTLLARSRGGGEKVFFAEGRVYCYNCESAACEHSVPPDHLSVFAGYTPTGFPAWSEFFSVLLGRRDPSSHGRGDSRIDGLINDPPEVVAFCQGPDDLKAEQLRAFGKESALYEIAGQVVAGYLPLRGGGAVRVAVTAQAVRTLDNGWSRLRLNLVGRVPDFVGRVPGTAGRASSLVDFLKLEPDRELWGLFASADRRLRDLGGRKRAGGRNAPVRPVLTRLARGIESLYRRRRRRTRHALERGGERRAVGLALKDMEKAHPDRVFFDEREGTFIVVGPRWRIHVFTRNGKHVTSLVMNRDGVRKRIDTRRWRYVTKDEIKEIRSKAGRATNG